jgi:hypothetical protein
LNCFKAPAKLEYKDFCTDHCLEFYIYLSQELILNGVGASFGRALLLELPAYTDCSLSLESHLDCIFDYYSRYFIDHFLEY